jgi:hypothetical protein
MRAEGHNHVTRAEIYRKEAARIRGKAARLASDDIRRELLMIAHEYDLLALSVERSKF